MKGNCRGTKREMGSYKEVLLRIHEQSISVQAEMAMKGCSAQFFWLYDWSLEDDEGTLWERRVWIFNCILFFIASLISLWFLYFLFYFFKTEFAFSVGCEIPYSLMYFSHCLQLMVKITEYTLCWDLWITSPQILIKDHTSDFKVSARNILSWLRGSMMQECLITQEQITKTMM